MGSLLGITAKVSQFVKTTTSATIRYFGVDAAVPIDVGVIGR
jgi:hypothetical protein